MFSPQNTSVVVFSVEVSDIKFVCSNS